MIKSIRIKDHTIHHKYIGEKLVDKLSNRESLFQEIFHFHLFRYIWSKKTDGENWPAKNEMIKILNTFPSKKKNFTCDNDNDKSIDRYWSIDDDDDDGHIKW